MTTVVKTTSREVSVLGVYDDPYSRLVLRELRRQRVPVANLLLVRAREHVGSRPALRRALLKLLTLRDRPGPYQALSYLDPFFWMRLAENRAFRRSAVFRELMGDAASARWEDLVGDARVVEVPSVNHARAYVALSAWRPGLMILGGVGIVAAPLLDLAGMTLNAHPAPLPECPGGGALEFTLTRGLEPTATVHLAHARADAGPVLASERVELLRGDGWETLEWRLTVSCARLLAKVAAALTGGAAIAARANEGKLNLWRDCDRRVQLRARRELRRRLRELP